jgi:hypothetical protein
MAAAAARKDTPGCRLAARDRKRIEGSYTAQVIRVAGAVYGRWYWNARPDVRGIEYNVPRIPTEFQTHPWPGTGWTTPRSSLAALSYRLARLNGPCALFRNLCLRIPNNLPEVTINILEVPGIYSPRPFMRRVGDCCAGCFRFAKKLFHGASTFHQIAQAKLHRT